MSDVYEVMAGQGLCAYPGGERSVRVIPEALEFIRSRADGNRLARAWRAWRHRS